MLNNDLKKIKIVDENLNGIDRLSALPDAILADILSLLPFTTAITTGILSWRWLRLWNQLTSIRINTTSTFPIDCYWIYFDQFLEQLSSSEIQLFEFNAPARIDTHDFFQLFIPKIIDLNVKEFKVNFTNFDFLNCVLLPNIVLQSRSMKVLELGFGCHYEFPENGVNLPNLTKLDICICEYHVEFIGKLVKCCPVLEDLRIQGEFSGYEYCIDVIAVNLKWLRIDMRCYLPFTRVVIDAPKLEFFHVSGPNLLKYCFVKIPSKLVNVEVWTKFDRGISKNGHLEWELVRSIANARSVDFQGDISPAFYYMNDYPLPVFHALVSLELVLHFPTFWKGLMRLLEFCPNLQIVRLQRKDFVWYGTGWIKLDIVPACLLNKVKSIIFRDFLGVKQELVLLSYILTVAKVLETLHVSIVAPVSEERQRLQLRKEFEFRRELYRFPKGSESCQIKVVSQCLPG